MSRKSPKLRLVTNEETASVVTRRLSKLDWIAVGLLAAVLVLAPLVAATFPTPPQSAYFTTAELSDILPAIGLPLLLALIAVAFGVLAWREWKRPVAIGGVSGLTPAVLLLGAWAVASLIRTPALGQSLNALAALLGALLLAGLASRLARDEQGFLVLLLAIVLGGSIIGGMGVNEFLAKWKSGDPQLRSFVTFFNPNFLAGYLLLTLPVTLGAFAAAEERMLRLALSIGLVLQSACLMLSASRAGAAMGLAAVLVWLALSAYSGGLKPRLKPVGLALLLYIVSTALASAPTLARLRASTPAGQSASSAKSAPIADTQSHSGAYRQLTWTGTVRMATANPLLGTGIGSYDVAYPRYTLAAPTAHAHNAFLQWAAETGLPGLLALLASLAAATAFAAFVLRNYRLRLKEQEQDDEAEDTYPAEQSGALLNGPALVLSGLIAAILASMLHSLFDSDWYIVCILFTLSGVVGLMIAQARDIAPLATLRPEPLAKPAFAVGALLALFLLWRAGSAGFSRYEQTLGRDAIRQASEASLTSFSSPEQAVSFARDAFLSAAAADPFDSEPDLNLAQIDAMLREPEAATKSLETATQKAATGKAFYRLGRLYAQKKETEKAIHAFERAREIEPKSVQNLRQLADTLREAGKTDEAALVYENMTELQNATYGQVRAVPELVETEFGYAHLGLADIAREKGDWQKAISEYQDAARVFREYWQKRNLPENQQRIYTDAEKRIPTLKHQEILDDYDRALTRLQEAYRNGKSIENGESIRSEQEQFHQERAAEEAEAKKAQNQ